MTEELDAFRDQFRRFLAKELAPHAEKWRQDKIVDRAAWRALGDIGALLPSPKPMADKAPASPTTQR
jgi:acyl-CoA dehydrogenase